MHLLLRNCVVFFAFVPSNCTSKTVILYSVLTSHAPCYQQCTIAASTDLSLLSLLPAPRSLLFLQLQSTIRYISPSGHFCFPSIPFQIFIAHLIVCSAVSFPAGLLSLLLHHVRTTTTPRHFSGGVLALFFSMSCAYLLLSHYCRLPLSLSLCVRFLFMCAYLLCSLLFPVHQPFLLGVSLFASTCIVLSA